MRHLWTATLVGSFVLASVSSAPLVVAPVAAQSATPTWSDLSALTHPALTVPGSDLLGQQIAIAPSRLAAQPGVDPRRLAYCGTDGIQRSLDGGLSWSQVPIDAVAGLAANTAYPLAPHGDGSPVCQAVALDPTEPDTFYAVFPAVRAPQDAPPPRFATGYFTRDAGQSWQEVPAPADGSLQFGGFVAHESGVQALFNREAVGSSREGVPVPVVEATNDGGQSWHETPFACPPSGPCIRFGAPPTGIGSCAMHGYGQPLLVSADSGQTWTTSAGAAAVNACQSNELAILTDTDMLLLAPGAAEVTRESAPVKLSRDGGRSFVPLGLPESGGSQEPFELKLLPDGRLLALMSGPTWSWQILEPSEDHWCSPTGVLMPANPVPLSVAADRLWWLDGAHAPQSMRYADIVCSVLLVPTPTPGR